MSTTPPNQPSVSPKHPGKPDEKNDVQPPFEEQIREIWEKKENRNAVYFGCAIVVILIIGWYGYKALAAQHEAEIEAAYAAAVTPARLRAFAQENSGHPLAGAAFMKMADDAYTVGNYTEAVANYDKAAAALPGTSFATRALFGKTMSQIRSGKAPEATAMLRQLAGGGASAVGAMPSNWPVGTVVAALAIRSIRRCDGNGSALTPQR